MMSRRFGWSVAAAALTLGTVTTWWQWPQIDRRVFNYGLKVKRFATGLEVPWSLAFLPDGSMLVTERPGRLRRVDGEGRLSAPIRGLPAVAQGGEAGLLDVAVAPDFATSRRVFLTFSEPARPGEQGASTALARARLENDELVDFRVIYRQPKKLEDVTHYGSRVLFTPEGHLLLALGDRGQRADAQDLSSPHGKVLRLTQDGLAVPDNPFANKTGALPEVWSYGHRNVQGMAWQPGTGALWATEHGPNGGDEINLLRAGANYGWPVITYGCEYVSCAKIGEGTAKAGMEQPVAWFGPDSVPLTGMAFVTSDRYPKWKGQLFVGVLTGPEVVRVQVDGSRVVERTPMWLGAYDRVRDVKQGPDGWLYLAVQKPEGLILRLER